MFAANVTYAQRARVVFWLKRKVARGRGNSRTTCGGSVAACLVVAPGRRFSRAGGTGDPIQEGLNITGVLLSMGFAVANYTRSFWLKPFRKVIKR